MENLPAKVLIFSLKITRKILKRFLNLNSLDLLDAPNKKMGCQEIVMKLLLFNPSFREIFLFLTKDFSNPSTQLWQQRRVCKPRKS